MPLRRTSIHVHQQLIDKTSSNYERFMAREAVSHLNPLGSML